LACSGAPSGPDVAVEHAWARPVAVPDSASSGGWNSAVYLQLVNRGRTADRLMAASSEVAATVEIHESRVEDGVMRMRPVDDTIAVTLSFQQSAPLAILVPVEQR
jgi:copper(I)-binding protein